MVAPTFSAGCVTDYVRDFFYKSINHFPPLGIEYNRKILKGRKGMNEILQAALIPFIGTAAGSACVFFMRGGLNTKVRSLLSAFAAGIMTAASVWSLIIPAIDRSSQLGKLAFIPVSTGFMTGIVCLLLIDRFILYLKRRNDRLEPEKKTSMLVLAVVIHNIPEGMAAGAVYAAILAGSNDITISAALALVIGISIQNFPEGAIISLPLRSKGFNKPKAFLYGILSGVAESAGALVTIAAAGLVVPVLPFLLSFAAGAMIYVVIKELIPEFPEGRLYDLCTVVFAAGFIVMMSLDTALG